MPYLKLGGGTPTEITSSGTYTVSNGNETIDVVVHIGLLPDHDTSDVIGVSKVIRKGFVYLNGETGTPSITSSIIDEYDGFNNGSYSASVTGTNNPPHRLSSFSQTIYDTAYGNVIDVVESPIIETNDVTYEEDVVMGNGNITYIGSSTLSKRGFCYTKTETDPTIDDWIVYEEPTEDYNPIMTEFFDDLSHWGIVEGDAEINPSGQLHLSILGGQDFITYTTPIIISGNTFELETSLILNNLGVFNLGGGDANVLTLMFGLAESGFSVYCVYSTNGIFLFYNGYLIQQIGTVIPSYGGSAEWQNWKWRITNSTFEVLLDVDGVYVSQGETELPITFTGDTLSLFISTISMSAPVETHIDYLKINTLSTTPLSTGTYSLPLTAVSVDDNFRVRSYVEYNETDISYGNTVTVSHPVTSNILYWVGNSGSWDDISHWSYESGGIGGASIPTSGHYVIFDNNSFTTNNQTVTIITGSFYNGSIKNDCITFSMYISTSLSCYGELTVDNNNIRINGTLILQENSIFYGSCYVEILHRYNNSIVNGNNTIGTMNIDVNNNIPGSTFYFGQDSIQTVDHFRVINVSNNSHAVLLDKLKPITIFTSTPTMSLSAGNNVTLSWNTSNTSSCTLDNVTKNISGGQIVTPLNETTYELKSKGLGGIITDNIVIDVVDTSYNDGFQTVKPEIVSFTKTILSPIIEDLSSEIPVGTTITITHESSGAQIYYTLDGTTPTITSSLYSVPITSQSDDFIGDPPTITIKSIAYSSSINEYSSVSVETAEKLIYNTVDVDYTYNTYDTWKYDGVTYNGTILTVGSGGDYAGLYDAYDAVEFDATITTALILVDPTATAGWHDFNLDGRNEGYLGISGIKKTLFIRGTGDTPSDTTIDMPLYGFYYYYMDCDVYLENITFTQSLWRMCIGFAPASDNLNFFVNKCILSPYFYGYSYGSANSLNSKEGIQAKFSYVSVYNISIDAQFCFCDLSSITCEKTFFEATPSGRDCVGTLAGDYVDTPTTGYGSASGELLLTEYQTDVEIKKLSWNDGPEITITEDGTYTLYDGDGININVEIDYETLLTSSSSFTINNYEFTNGIKLIS